jgi:ribonuclease D
LEWVLEDGAAAVQSAIDEGPAPYLRLKSAWKLPPRQLAVLSAICDWREQRARGVDKPRSWILSDKLCLAVAQRCPTNLAELRGIPEMPPALVRKQGEVLLDLIDAALAQPEQEWPSAMAKPLDQQQREQLKRLKTAASKIAQDWDVQPEALFPSKDYELMIRLGSGEAVDRPSRWLGWRREVLVAPLLHLVGVEADD